MSDRLPLPFRHFHGERCDLLDFNARDAGIALNVDDGVLLRTHAVREADGGAVGQSHLEFLWGECDDHLGWQAACKRWGLKKGGGRHKGHNLLSP